MFCKLHWSQKQEIPDSPLKIPPWVKRSHLTSLGFAAAFHFSIGLEMHLCTEEMLKCGLQRERATYFHSDLVFGSAADIQLYSKKQKDRERESTSLVLSFQAAIQGDSAPCCALIFYLAFIAFSFYSRIKHCLKKERRQ